MGNCCNLTTSAIWGHPRGLLQDNRWENCRPDSGGCKVAGMVANADQEIVEALESFGWEVGRAFQMVDDLLDLTGNPRMGKPRGTDIYEGKMTLPIIHALTTLHGNNRENRGCIDGFQ